MNRDEQKKAEDFYIKSDINGIHTPRINMVEINYLDMAKLMHSYAQHQVKKLSLTSVSKQALSEAWNDGYIKGCEHMEASHKSNI